MKFNNKLNSPEPTAQPKNFPISQASPEVTSIFTFSFHSLDFFLNSYITYVIILEQYIVRLYLLSNFIKMLFYVGSATPFSHPTFFPLRHKHIAAVAVVNFSLLYSIPLCEYTTIYLPILFFSWSKSLFDQNVKKVILLHMIQLQEPK